MVIKTGENSNFGVLLLSAIFVISASATGCVSQAVTETCHPPDTVAVPAGDFIFGSSAQEREYAYQLDQQAYGHSITRDSQWYAQESPLQTITADGFEITKNPITNRQYLQFVQSTDHAAPQVDRATWTSYRLIHPYSRTQRHQWTNGLPPADRDNHPVVLVSYNDATAYASWLSQTSGNRWRLPTEREWVVAARGSDGRIFPWGNEFDADKLNSHDKGPFDTVDVGSLSAPSPYGTLDSAGQVFEWVAAAAAAKRAWVKGGSWDDKGCGVCRPAARHSRPKTLKHILIGFRLVKE